MTAIPVNLITGFLGSGKTTLLQRLLPSQELAGAAVLVNEFGEVGLDHHLLQRVDEAIVLLKSGCLCCTIRGDLRDSVRDLYDRRERGSIPAFDRLVIETTGLADPAPIVATFMADPVICHHFRLGNIITVVDARNGRSNLASFEESRKQAAVADRIVISKTDITPLDEIDLLRQELLHINRTAIQFDSGSDALSPSVLMANDVYDPRAKAGEVRAWLADENDLLGHEDHQDHDDNRHGSDIIAICVSLDIPLDWTAFALWLTMLLNRHGQNILRVKGMLNIRGVTTPVIIHGVQHTIHPTTHLDAWPDGIVRTSLIFIARGLVRARLQESLEAFNRL
ncbi:MAG: CobW family GTP-binding protein, partial [Aestuariivirgaceae bacterium]